MRAPFLGLFICGLVFLTAAQVHASVAVTGSNLSGNRNSNQVITNYGWVGPADGSNFKISWNILAPGAPGNASSTLWSYDYSFNTAATPPYVFLLEVLGAQIDTTTHPNDLTSVKLTNWTNSTVVNANVGAGTAFPPTAPTYDAEYGTFAKGTATEVNPPFQTYLPNQLQGIAFQLNPQLPMSDVTFLSDRAPEWGDFYVADGGGSSTRQATNLAFSYGSASGTATTNSPAFSSSSLAEESGPTSQTTLFTDWIPVVGDGLQSGQQDGTVPEPSAFVVWSLLTVFGIAHVRRRSKNST